MKRLEQLRQQAVAAKEAYDAYDATAAWATQAHKSVAGEFMNRWDDPDWALLVLDALNAAVGMRRTVLLTSVSRAIMRDRFDSAMKKLENS